jgi:hypothetical protein
MTAPAAEGAVRPDDAVTGGGRIAALTHDRPDRPPRPWGSGQSRDIAVRCHPAAWNPSYDGHDAGTELRHSARLPARTVTPGDDITAEPAMSLHLTLEYWSWFV